MNKFQVSVQFLVDPSDGFDAEGGYVNNPKDPGGETKYGIAKRSHPDVDIKNLTLDGAIDIYHREYWLAYNIEQYEMPFGAAVLDSYVQHSPNKVKLMLETAGGSLQALLEARRQYYIRLIDQKPVLARFKKGWFNRINELSKYCSIIMQ